MTREAEMEEERGPLARRRRTEFAAELAGQRLAKVATRYHKTVAALGRFGRPSCLRWVSWVREAGGRVTGFSWVQGSLLKLLRGSWLNLLSASAKGGRLLADMPKDQPNAVRS